MQDAFYEFEWTVAPHYEWQVWRDRRGRALVLPKEGLSGLDSAAGVELAWNLSLEEKREYGPVLSPRVPEGSTSRSYRPMDRDHAALFREFAALDYRSEEGMLEFARRYGNLGVRMQTQGFRYRDSRGHWREHFAHGESFLQWAFEICLMREGLRTGETQVSTEDARRAQWLFNRNLQHVQGRLVFHPAGQPRLVLEPLTLVAAMWLQLGLAVTGDKQFVACKFCRRLFEISTDQSGFRRHREFCTDSCKTKDYRKRRRTALRLFASGSVPAAISERTETPLKTVRGWLAAAKTRPTQSKTGGE